MKPKKITIKEKKGKKNSAIKEYILCTIAIIVYLAIVGFVEGF